MSTGMISAVRDRGDADAVVGGCRGAPSDRGSMAVDVSALAVVVVGVPARHVARQQFRLVRVAAVPRMAMVTEGLPVV